MAYIAVLMCNPLLSLDVLTDKVFYLLQFGGGSAVAFKKLVTKFLSKTLFCVALNFDFRKEIFNMDFASIFN